MDTQINTLSRASGLASKTSADVMPMNHALAKNIETPLVHVTLQTQKDIINLLDDTIGVLENRLQPVLTPRPEKESGNVGVPAAITLSSQIQANNEALDYLNSKLQSLINNFEI